MNALIEKLPDFGALGIVCALLIYNVYFLQKKVIAIVENNTKALTEMREVIKECQFTHTERN